MHTARPRPVPRGRQPDTRAMALLDQAQLNRAIAELKATTRVTMETVGVRFGRRVSTAVYR